MTWIDWLYILTVPASAVAAILAWTAKLRWAREYREAKQAELRAKDEVLRAKDAQIAVLRAQIEQHREFSSVKVHEGFMSMKSQLEDFIGQLQQEVAERDEQIKQLRQEGQAARDEIERLTKERNYVSSKIDETEDYMISTEEFLRHFLGLAQEAEQEQAGQAMLEERYRITEKAIALLAELRDEDDRKEDAHRSTAATGEE